MRYHTRIIGAAIELHREFPGEVDTRRASKVWGCGKSRAYKRLNRMEEGGIVNRARSRWVQTSTGPRKIARWRWATVPPRQMSGVEWRVYALMSDGKERTAQEISDDVGVALTHAYGALRGLMEGDPLVIDVDQITSDKGRPVSVYQETSAALRSLEAV